MSPDGVGPRGSLWRRAAGGDMARVADALRHREWAYVPFSSRLRDDGPPSPWKRGWGVLVEDERRQPPSAVMVTRSGLVLPALRDTSPLPRDLRPQVLRVSNTIYSIMGVKADVVRMEQLLGLAARTTVDYSLLTVDAGSLRRAPPVPSGLRLQRANASDTRLLFDLQRAYELEEVIINPARFNAEQCMRMLRRSLRTEIVYYATLDGTPVAKAGTNARGFDVDQIGGVFTAVPLRNKGLGAIVLGALLEELLALGKSATLFVKLDNAAALRLYEKLGFRERGFYRICYYYD